MVRGESEYENSKAQYNQYQLGYDEKLSVDKRWTVGAAVTFSEGDSSYGYGSTEDKSTAFAIYGSKLNDDGTFVDLIARYAHLESDVEDQAGKGDYSTNGMSVSAEFGKRIEQGNGLWIEPQFELTYGNFDSAEFQIGGKTVQVGDMDSLIGRIGFSLGKDIKQGNVYARASYLYDFDGETETAFFANFVKTTTFGAAAICPFTATVNFAFFKLVNMAKCKIVYVFSGKFFNVNAFAIARNNLTMHNCHVKIIFVKVRDLIFVNNVALKPSNNNFATAISNAVFEHNCIVWQRVYKIVVKGFVIVVATQKIKGNVAGTFDNVNHLHFYRW